MDKKTCLYFQSRPRNAQQLPVGASLAVRICSSSLRSSEWNIYSSKQCSLLPILSISFPLSFSLIRWNKMLTIIYAWDEIFRHLILMHIPQFILFTVFGSKYLVNLPCSCKKVQACQVFIIVTIYLGWNAVEQPGGKNNNNSMSLTLLPIHP